MRTIAAGLAAAFLSSAAFAETPLFAENSEIAFTIEAPLRELIRNSADSTAPYPATLTLSSDGQAQAFPIELSARGISRRIGGVCDFPPLRLDFDKAALDGTLFDGQNRLKLVTHCRATDRYEQSAALEMLAYRLYNVITEASFRVRPAQITYRYSDRNGREETHFGFLIEDVDDVADRNGLVALDVQSAAVGDGQLDAAAAARYALFQLLIANLDWDMTHGPDPEDCCHNSKLLGAGEDALAGLTPVPYDFDHSGLVDAPYSAPPEQAPVRSVRQRYYWGICAHNAALPDAIAEFQTQRDALLAAVDQEARLSQSKRDGTKRYIEGFFEIIDDEGRFERLVIRRCRE